MQKPATFIHLFMGLTPILGWFGHVVLAYGRYLPDFPWWTHGSFLLMGVLLCLQPCQRRQRRDRHPDRRPTITRMQYLGSLYALAIACGFIFSIRDPIAIGTLMVAGAPAALFLGGTVASLLFWCQQRRRRQNSNTLKTKPTSKATKTPTSTRVHPL